MTSQKRKKNMKKFNKNTHTSITEKEKKNYCNIHKKIDFIQHF